MPGHLRLGPPRDDAIRRPSVDRAQPHEYHPGRSCLWQAGRMPAVRSNACSEEEVGAESALPRLPLASELTSYSR